MYIYHPHEVFLAGYDWFEEKNLYFNTQVRVYHIFVYLRNHRLCYS